MVLAQQGGGAAKAIISDYFILWSSSIHESVNKDVLLDGQTWWTLQRFVLSDHLKMDPVWVQALVVTGYGDGLAQQKKCV